jgi:hypothetical protein
MKGQADRIRDAAAQKRRLREEGEALTKGRQQPVPVQGVVLTSRPHRHPVVICISCIQHVVIVWHPSIVGA